MPWFQNYLESDSDALTTVIETLFQAGYMHIKLHRDSPHVKPGIRLWQTQTLAAPAISD